MQSSHSASTMTNIIFTAQCSAIVAPPRNTCESVYRQIWTKSY